MTDNDLHSQPSQPAADTICAISTPPGVGGIAVCRVSGPRAIALADSIWHGRPLAQAESHTAHLGEVLDTSRQPLDQAVATVFRTPRSFTGEDVVEISVHGSRYVQAELLDSLLAAGCRLADPGEFTRRAFLAGRFDLAQAEAVADLIASESRAAHRIALTQMKGGFSQRLQKLRSDLIELASLLELELDFSEEDVEFASRERLLHIARQVSEEITRLLASFRAGAAIKDGIPVAIVGDTNAGKSSLLNRLLGDDRAIVSDIHGTTRDTIEETLPVGDYRLRLIDTAGLRQTTDAIERLGIDRSRQAISRARVIVMVADRTAPLNSQLLSTLLALPDAHIILAANKSDLITNLSGEAGETVEPDEAGKSNVAERPEVNGKTYEAAWSLPPSIPVVNISAATGQGVDHLKQMIVDAISAEASQTDILVTNARHAAALSAALSSITRVISALTPPSPHPDEVLGVYPHPGEVLGGYPLSDDILGSYSLSGDILGDYPLSGDLIAQDVRETIHHLSAITGSITTTDLLSTIFSRFCIGK